MVYTLKVVSPCPSPECDTLVGIEFAPARLALGFYSSLSGLSDGLQNRNLKTRLELTSRSSRSTDETDWSQVCLPLCPCLKSLIAVVSDYKL